MPGELDLPGQRRGGRWSGMVPQPGLLDLANAHIGHRAKFNPDTA